MGRFLKFHGQMVQHRHVVCKYTANEIDCKDFKEFGAQLESPRKHPTQKVLLKKRHAS